MHLRLILFFVTVKLWQYVVCFSISLVEHMQHVCSFCIVVIVVSNTMSLPFGVAFVVVVAVAVLLGFLCLVPALRSFLVPMSRVHNRQHEFSSLCLSDQRRLCLREASVGA